MVKYSEDKYQYRLEQSRLYRARKNGKKLIADLEAELEQIKTPNTIDLQNQATKVMVETFGGTILSQTNKVKKKSRGNRGDKHK